MTPQEFHEEMLRLIELSTYEENGPDGKEDHFDAEHFHGMADNVLCNVLEELGYKDGVEVFRHAEKWYA